MNARAVVGGADATVDVLVVGAGPAGLAAAAGLRGRGARVLVVDAGGALEARARTEPGSLVCGVGGAGLYSDGKFSFYPAATALWSLRDRGAFARAYEHLSALLAPAGIDVPPWTMEAPRGPPARPAGWHCKRYPSQYAGLAARETLTRALLGATETLLRTRLTGLRYEDGAHRATLVTPTGEARVRAPRVVLAAGRFAPRTLGAGVEGAYPSRFSRIEVGVRVEAPSAHPFFVALDGVDPKWLFDGTPSLRTFCLCRDGEVLPGQFDGVQSVSGRADGPPTGRSNLGLLVRWTRPCAEARAALEGVLARANSPANPVALADALARGPAALAGLVPGSERAVFGALEALCAGFPALRAARDGVLLHGPCIEGLGRYPACDDDLALGPGLWVAGDGSGRFRGLVAALLSGLYVADRCAEAY